MIKRLARFKIYIDRARWYYVLVQFFLILLIYFNSMDFNLDWWHYLIVILVAFSGMVIVGFIDRRIGLIKEEQRFYAIENPVLADIVRRLKTLEREII